MSFWFTLFLWAATFVISDYFRAKLPAQEPSGEGDFQSPTSTEGRKVPQVVGGTVKIKGPNTLFYGDWEAEAVTVETGIIFKRDETIGYKYRVALALGQFQGRAAGMTGIYIGDDKVWDYVADNSSVPGTVADINLPELFGGAKNGGGFVGRVRAFTGENDQPVSSYLASKTVNQSAWRGFVYVVVTNQSETAGAEIGESNSLRDIRIEWQTYDTIANGGLGNELSLTGDMHIIGRDSNPISAAYRVLQNADFSIASSDINFANFQSVAAVCYTEGIGYSQVVDNELEAFEILAEIEKHIDGYIGPNPTNGLLEVKLARNDYTPASEFQATEENIQAINNYAKPEWPQTKNEVKIRFVNREKDYKDDHAVAQDMAGRLIAGRPQSITIRFPGLRDAIAANVIVTRTSRGYFWPLSKFELEMDRTAYSKRPGDIVMVTHPDIAAVDLPTRITRTRTGDPIKQTIKLDVVEDVFQNELGLLAAPPASEHVPPSTTPVTITNDLAIQIPRWMYEINAQPFEPRLLFLVAKDLPNTGYGIAYRTRASAGGGAFTGDIDDTPTLGVFTKRGTLRAQNSPEIGLDYLKYTANNGAGTVAQGAGFYVDGDLDSLVGAYDPFTSLDGLAVIDPEGPNEEFVAITTVAIDGAGIECSGVIRCIGDSPMRQHAVGEDVWFLDNGPYLQANARPSETDDNYGYQYKLTPISQAVLGTQSAYSGEKAVSLAKMLKPYPPTAVIFDQLSTTVWFQDGGLDASAPDNISVPTAQGINVEIWNRRFDQANPIYGANSVNDIGAGYATNFFSDVDPALVWWLYDLDTTPTPTHGTDAILSGTELSLNDRTNQKFFSNIDFDGIPNIISGFNCRFEFGWQNQASPGIDGVLAGVDSNYVTIDKTVLFTYGPESTDAVADTLLLLHFEGLDRTTQVIDYSPYNHAVTLSGGVEIDTSIPDDAFGSPENPLMLGHLLHQTQASQSPEQSPLVADYKCEVTDVSPNAFERLSVTEGFVIQARVYFTVAPSGEIPIVTKWRTSDNERQFWFGLNNTTLRFKHSNDGTAELIETTGTRTWTLNTWYEIVVCVWETQCYFFVDGVFDENEPQTFGTPHLSAAPVRVGSDGDGNTVPATTYIDAVRIVAKPVYKAPFTKNIVHFPGREFEQPLLIEWDNANDGDTTYITEDLNRMTVEFPANEVTEIDSAESTFVTSPIGKSLLCSGVQANSFDDSDGVRVLETKSTGKYARNWEFGLRDLTMECFVKFNIPPNSHTGAAIAFITKYNRGPSPFLNWYLVMAKAAPTIQFTYRSAVSTDTTLISSTLSDSPQTGVWHHVAFCRKDGAASLFWNGNRVGFHATSFAAVSIDNHHPSNVAIGRLEDNGTVDVFALNGWIDNVRVLNGTAAYDGATYTVPTAAFPRDPFPQDAPPAPPAPAENPSNWQPSNL